MHINLTDEKAFNLNSSAKEVSVGDGQFALKSQADSIDFSNKLIEVLKDKVKEHNDTCPRKTSISQLKKIYVRSAQSYSPEKYPDITRSIYALASVNKFIDWTKIKNEKQESNSIVLELVQESELSAEDLNLARSEIEKYELNVAEFDPRHDLFISDNDYPVKLSCRVNL